MRGQRNIVDDDVREMIRLGFSQAEMATELGCTELNVERRVRKVRRLGDFGFDARMGERRFTECPRAQRDYGSPERLPPVSYQPHSLTGCAASLACV